MFHLWQSHFHCCRSIGWCEWLQTLRSLCNKSHLTFRRAIGTGCLPKSRNILCSLRFHNIVLTFKEGCNWMNCARNLKYYFKLKAAWGLGHIILTLSNNRERIHGYYVDLENRKREVFLSNNFLQATRRLNRVKSFLDMSTKKRK